MSDNTPETENLDAAAEPTAEAVTEETASQPAADDTTEQLSLIHI